ncbi:MAG: hypothetical protein AAFN27_21780 [Pseudomonadota bacterium]
MLRTALAILLSLSIAVPGIAAGSSEHHAHQVASHAGHDHHHHDGQAACDGSDCDVEIVMVCCAMMAGHCSSIGVTQDCKGATGTVLSGTAELSSITALLLTGQTFEADPPPPRT